MLEKVNLKLQIKLMKFTNLKFWRKKRRKTISPDVKLFPRVKLFRLLPPPAPVTMVIFDIFSHVYELLRHIFFQLAISVL